MPRRDERLAEEQAAARAGARAQEHLIGTCVVSGHRTTFMAEWLPLPPRRGTFIACRRGALPITGVVELPDVREGEGLCWWCWVAGWSLVRAGWRWVAGVLVRDP